MKNLQKRGVRTGAFTLLELIAVMGIIVALSSVVVAGFGVMLRAIARTSGEEAIVKAIKLTRQHAITDGRDTFLFITDHDSYVLCRRGGTVTSVKSGESLEHPQMGVTVTAHWILDKFADLQGSMETFDESKQSNESVADKKYRYHGVKVFNLSNNKSASLAYPPFYDFRENSYIIGLDPATGPSVFPSGSAFDSYGWTLYPEQKLPKGFAFMIGGSFPDRESLEKNTRFIAFDASGSASGNNMEFRINELAAAGKSPITVTVDAKGKITINEYGVDKVK